MALRASEIRQYATYLTENEIAYVYDKKWFAMLSIST